MVHAPAANEPAWPVEFVATMATIVAFPEFSDLEPELANAEAKAVTKSETVALPVAHNETEASPRSWWHWAVATAGVAFAMLAATPNRVIPSKRPRLEKE